MTVCGICRASANSILCPENEVVAVVALEGCIARQGRALNAELRSLSLPTGYGL